MRGLTIRQPWALCVVQRGKVENRTQLWTYRGPVLIHAGATDAVLPNTPQGDLARQACADLAASDTRPTAAARAAGIAVAELVDVHPGTVPACCQPWGEDAYVDAFGRDRRGVVHLLFEDMRELAWPVPMRGRLGLWLLSTDEREAVDRALAGVRP